MSKIINSVIAIMLFILAYAQLESNRINRRIARIEGEHNRQLSEHNRLLQEQIIESQVESAALSEISRSIDQVGEYPITQRN
jgi:hypothetical protein